jgi:hypothetical protein
MLSRVCGPPILLLIGYAFPSLAGQVAWPIPAEVLSSLLILVLIAAAWLLFEIIPVVSRNTSVAELQTDFLISTFWAVVMTGVAGWYIHAHGMPWWYVVGWATSLLDGFLSGTFAINNAAQKPFFSKQTGQ